MARMAGQLCTRIICLFSAPGSERSVIGMPIPALDWHTKAVKMGEVSLETKCSIFDNALLILQEAGRARPLFTSVLENPANAAASGASACSFINCTASVRVVGDALVPN